MPGEFDESKHPRADDGKFGEGGGPAKADKGADKAKRAKALVDSAKKLKAEKSSAGKAGKDAKPDKAEAPKGPEHGSDEYRAKRLETLRTDRDTLTADDEAKVHADVDNEQRVIAAGHIDPPPTEKFGEFEKLTNDSLGKINKIADDLDEARKAVREESKKLESLSLEDPDGSDDDDHNIGSDIDFYDLAEDSTHSIVNDIRKTSDEDAPDDSADPVHLEKVEEPEKPERDEYVGYEDDGDEPDAAGRASFDEAMKNYETQLAAHNEYKEALVDRRKQFDAQAEKTHAAIEKLLAVQKSAIDAVKDVDKQTTKAYRAADKENEKYVDSDLADGISEAETAAAENALNSLYGHRYTQLNQMWRSVDTADLVPALRDAARETTSKLKGLSKYLGKNKKIEEVADDDEPGDEE
jgi:hypothetical protein